MKTYKRGNLVEEADILCTRRVFLKISSYFFARSTCGELVAAGFAIRQVRTHLGSTSDQVLKIHLQSYREKETTLCAQ